MQVHRPQVLSSRPLLQHKHAWQTVLQSHRPSPLGAHPSWSADASSTEDASGALKQPGRVCHADKIWRLGLLAEAILQCNHEWTYLGGAAVPCCDGW